MKILTFNLARPNPKTNKSRQILEKLDELNGDILILTETHSSMVPQGDYQLVSTKPLLSGFDGIGYKTGENRVSIWTKYPISKSQMTYDGFTSVCAGIETPFGTLTVYGTIIGVFGGKGQRFKEDLRGQKQDFEQIFPNKQVCLAGDYNISFTGYAYPSHSAREELYNVFEKYSLTNLTASIPNSVDHIALSEAFLKNKKVTIETWNMDKKLSDHIGVGIELLEM